MCKYVFEDYTYVSLENPDNKEFALHDPRGFLKQYHAKVIIDEAQNAPILFAYIQEIVDNSKIKGQYILSGSQNFLLLEKITQSLAGRTYIFHLLPFSYEELKLTKYNNEMINSNIFNGGYPRIYDDQLRPHEFFPSYIQTYIERDVRSIRNISNLSLFRQFLTVCAGRTGQLLNTNSIGNELGIDHKTVKSWLSILEASFIIYLLKPWHKNFKKRVVKAPKMYFYDTGLACYLLGIKDEIQVATHFLRGSLFENHVINEVLKSNYNRGENVDLFFWRNNIGNEVDLIIDTGLNTKLVEIKSSQTINPTFFKGIQYLQSISNMRSKSSFIIYGGDVTQLRTGTSVLPWFSLDMLNDY